MNLGYPFLKRRPNEIRPTVLLISIEKMSFFYNKNYANSYSATATDEMHKDEIQSLDKKSKFYVFYHKDGLSVQSGRVTI